MTSFSNECSFLGFYQPSYASLTMLSLQHHQLVLLPLAIQSHMQLYIRLALATLDQQGCSWQLPGHIYIFKGRLCTHHALTQKLISCAEMHLACEAMRGFVFSWPLLLASTVHVTSTIYELIEGSRKLVTYNSQGMRVAGVTSWWMQSEPVQVSMRCIFVNLISHNKFSLLTTTVNFPTISVCKHHFDNTHLMNINPSVNFVLCELWDNRMVHHKQIN